jgi:hypothetical protein
LDDFAALLGVEDWRTEFDRIQGLRRVANGFYAFVDLSDESKESLVQETFRELVDRVAVALDVYIGANYSSELAVGGFLAEYEYAVRSVPDVSFYNWDNPKETILATEIKKRKAFDGESLWHHDSRGAQIFCAVYAFNAPTLLVSPKQYKLFIENKDRTEVLTFPHVPHPTVKTSTYLQSTATGSTGPNLLRIIVICLLSCKSKQSKETRYSSPISTRLEDENYLQDSASKRTKREHDLLKSSAEAVDVVIPSYVVGSDDSGNPIRRLIYVISSEQLEEFDEQIDKESAIAGN